MHGRGMPLRRKVSIGNTLRHQLLLGTKPEGRVTPTAFCKSRRSRPTNCHSGSAQALCLARYNAAVPSNIRAITVYCSSSSAIATPYLRAGAELGAAIARAGWTLVYGGNRIGL